MVALEALIVAVPLLLIGTAFCFYGYRWFMILLPICALIAGFAIGAASIFSIYGQSILSPIVIIVAGLITGLLLAVLAYMFFNLGIILLGAFLGYTLGFTLGSGIALSLGFDAGYVPIIAGLIAAAVVGFLAFRLNLPKYIIIALTALIGSEALLSGVLFMTGFMGFISLNDLKQGFPGPILSHSTAWTFSWLILAAVGAVMQLHRAKYYELDLESRATQNNRD